MLKIFRSHQGQLKELSVNEVEAGAWLQLIQPTEEELARVVALTGTPLELLRPALDVDERSRTELEEENILIITNVPIMRGVNSYDTLPLGIIICRGYFITVCSEPNPVLEGFGVLQSHTFHTAKKTRLLFQILFRSAELYLKYLTAINRRTDEIESKLRRSMKNEELFELLELHKGLTYFHAALRANGSVMERLFRLRRNNQIEHLIKMYEEDEDLLEDVIIENKQAIEMVEMYSNILNGMMDTFASIISNNLNIVMKFLASMTILIALPTMVSSFMGMNVDVPFGENNGFVIALTASCFLTVIGAFVLWKKGML
ncbi:MAG TPA: magnesium transporter CorA family protein [Patescibacteria group bacterium]|nr:magnesium transporter CorA family protein [Patescibacteria group bacterium]